MYKVDYTKFGIPNNMSREEAARLSTQNRVDSYNATTGMDDGTGVQCDLCRNRGAIAFVDPISMHFTVRPCKCQATRRTVTRLQKQGIYNQAKRYKLSSFHTDTETQKVMKRTVERFLADHTGHWLMLCGQSGAGKTHLCTAAFVQLSFREGMDGRYFLWNANGRQLKAASMEDDSGLWDKYKKCELLYVDDLFKGKLDPTDADVRLAFELLDYRYGNQLTTIISSEMSFGQLTALDEAVAGRIKEMCGSYLVNIEKAPEKNFRFYHEQ